jgi:hypothetical protein
LAKFAISASQESIDVMLQSPRVRASASVMDVLRSNPYLKAEQSATIAGLLNTSPTKPQHPVSGGEPQVDKAASGAAGELPHAAGAPAGDTGEGEEVPDETVSAYLAEHATEIAAQQDKPFQPVGGIVDLLGADYFPVVENKEMTQIVGEEKPVVATGSAPTAARPKPAAPPPGQRDNTVQKINRLDVKGRIQLAMKGNKEERSILIRDGTKVVALAVLDAPKISDGEVEKFALQKNVLEAVLRQIPLKRRFMKNYIVVRNLVSNPRTPLDLGLGLMKHLLTQDLKNISANKEVSETVRKLAMKMYKQKLDMANRK